LQDEYGGWESRRIIEDFTAYSIILFEEYGDKVKYWIVLNEPNIFTQLGYLLAMHPPGKKDMKTYLMTYRHTALVHANVVKLYKERGHKGYIGSSIAYTPGYSASEKEEDKEVLRRYYETVSWWLMDIYQIAAYTKWRYELFQKHGIAPEITEEDKMTVKYKMVCDDIEKDIMDGTYKKSNKLPAEDELIEKYRYPEIPYVKRLIFLREEVW